MNVTKKNFDEAAGEIERLLPSVDFVAIDEEMTGIALPGCEELVADLPAVRYGKMRKRERVATNFNIIQFGVALFTKDSTAQSYTVHAFNFYLFPEKGFVNMEAGSVHFNSRNGMDWNKWILGGIPYVDKDSAEKLKQSLLSEAAKQPQQTGQKCIVLSNPQDIETTTKAVESLKGWLSDEGRKEETEFEILTTNSYLRRFLYEHVRENMPDLILESRPTKARGLSTVVALRLTEAQKKERETKIQQEKEAEVQAKLGVTRVFTALAASKKPLIGHALMFDLLFALSHFESLPDNYSDFKDLSHNLFPTAFDTQVLAKSHLFRTKTQTDGEKASRFSSFALGQVYKVLKQEAEDAGSAGAVELKLAEGHERYENTASFHEAGYDAFVTGCVFAYMCAGLGRLPDEFNGHLVMFRGLYNFNLHGDDELLTKGAYLHIKGLKGRGVQDLQDSLKAVLSLGFWEGGSWGTLWMARLRLQCANIPGDSECNPSNSLGAQNTKVLHPNRFIGLSVKSSYTDFQAYYHNAGMYNCPRPCFEMEQACVPWSVNFPGPDLSSSPVLAAANHPNWWPELSSKSSDREIAKALYTPRPQEFQAADSFGSRGKDRNYSKTHRE
eukprot:Skav202969  [mRNA]  locus=scaffold2274:415691:421547:- [translate_table: standard]